MSLGGGTGRWTVYVLPIKCKHIVGWQVLTRASRERGYPRYASRVDEAAFTTCLPMPVKFKHSACLSVQQSNCW